MRRRLFQIKEEINYCRVSIVGTTDMTECSSDNQKSISSSSYKQVEWKQKFSKNMKKCWFYLILIRRKKRVNLSSYFKSN